MNIRPELSADIATLRDLTARAFAPTTFSDDTEAAALDMLRDTGDLVLSLVATDDSGIIGHVALSPMQSPKGWVGLGPISVEPARQKQGIGRKLITAGLTAIKAQGHAGVILLGNPAVYAGSGFISDGTLTYQDLPAQYIQYVAFRDPPPPGEIIFSAGLELTSENT
ncbi:MAG: N-acetyltransferase [Pseudomonadota bacterium]